MASNKPIPLPTELSPQTVAICDRLNNADDLDCVIISTAFLDHCLASLLQSRLVDGNTAISLLQPGRAIGDLSARAKLAYCLGLIPKELLNDIDRIGTIRNLFAHEFFSITFTNEQISKKCNELTIQGMKQVHGSLGRKLSARDIFSSAVLSASNWVLLAALSQEHIKKHPEITIRDGSNMEQSA